MPDTTTISHPMRRTGSVSRLKRIPAHINESADVDEHTWSYQQPFMRMALMHVEQKKTAFRRQRIIVTASTPVTTVGSAHPTNRYAMLNH